MLHDAVCPSSQEEERKMGLTVVEDGRDVLSLTSSESRKKDETSISASKSNIRPSGEPRARCQPRTYGESLKAETDQRENGQRERTAFCGSVELRFAYVCGVGDECAGLLPRWTTDRSRQEGR